MRVLLVDDEERFASVLAKRLRVRGIEATYATTGEDALGIAGGERFDVALLDIKMPGIGGLELRRRLAEVSPGLRFIFMTGHGSANDFASGSAVAHAYLAKPVDISELVAAIREVADRPESGEGSRG